MNLRAATRAGSDKLFYFARQEDQDGELTMAMVIKLERPRQIRDIF